MNKTEKYAYDIEIFPNFFSVVFKPIFGEEPIKLYVHEFDKDGEVYNKLYEFIDTSPCLIGYNSSRFDDILINYILKKEKIDVNNLYNIAQRIISIQKTDTPLWEDATLKWLLRPYQKMYTSIDLMRVLAFDKLLIGLKQCSVNLKHDRIQDLPKHYSEDVILSEIPDILSYNENDVDITKKLFFKIKDDLVLRHNIGEEYDVNLMNSSNTHIGKTILNYYYEKETGIEYNDFKSLRTPREYISFDECISDTISFRTKEFNKMLSDLREVNVTTTKKALDYKLLYKDKGYQLGMGGLHSIDGPEIFAETDEYYIIDCDVASMYPNIMLNFGIKPEHLTDEFFKILKDLTARRLEAKAEKNMTVSDALKISINSIYGLLNSNRYWLYDPKAAMSVTINGQLLLLMLIERLEMNGFEVISSNTDGVTAKVYKDREQEYYDICAEWEKDTMFELEYAYYSHYIRRDVNNYITKIRKVVEKGQSFDVDKIKKKGAFVTSVSLSKAFKNPIVPIALEKYYLEEIPITKTLTEHDDIYDFCKSQKVGSQFTVEHYKAVEHDGNYVNVKEPLQKTNRYFVSLEGGTLVKKKSDGEITNMESGFLTTILNDFDEEIDYKSNIDYNYYEKECRKIIDVISKNGQISLF